MSPHGQDLLHISPQHDRQQWVSLSPSADIRSRQVAFLSNAGAQHGDESSNQLSKDILERCMSKAGIRRTLISPNTDPGSKLVSSLPTLAPISLPKIPEPRDLYTKYEEKRSVFKQPLDTVAKPVAKESKPILGGSSVSSQPPLPSLSMQQQSKGLMDKMGTGNKVKISDDVSPAKDISAPASHVSQGTNIDTAKLSETSTEITGKIDNELNGFGKFSIQTTETQKDNSLAGSQAFMKPKTLESSDAQPFAVSQGFPMKATSQTQDQTIAAAGLESAPSISSESTISPNGSFSSMGQSAGIGKPSFSGTSSAFGQASTFGQASAFGQASTFGQASAFGQASTFGQASAFGQASNTQSIASPGQSSGFGQSSSLGQPPAFGQASGFGQASAFGQSTTGFSTLAQGQGSGFASMANQGKTEFASFAQMGQATSSFGTNPAKSSNSAMWQARK